MAEKVTIMVLKVDLQCPCCYKKVKKILCKFPQIRDQVFDEKGNKVTITVVCCSPEKIRDKLCYQGCRVIKGIEIMEPKEPEKPKVVIVEKPESEKPKHVTFEIPKDAQKPKGNGAHPPEKPKEVTKSDPNPIMFPLPAQGYAPSFPMQPCCAPCYEGYGGGPCYQGYRVPPPPQPCYGGYYGYDNEDHGRGTHVTRCDYYFSEENPQGCSIM